MLTEHRRTYFRESRHGPSLQVQIQAAKAQGWPWDEEDIMAAVYVDRLPKGKRGRHTPEGLEQRAALIYALRPDESLWVYGLDRLGLSGPDIQTAIEEIGRTGAAIHDGKEQRLHRWTPEALELSAAMRKATDVLAQERTAPGRRKAKDEGLITGAPSKRDRFSAEDLAEMERQWHNPMVRSGPAIARAWKLSVGTMVNWFGPRFAAAPGAPVIGPVRKPRKAG